MWFQPLTKAGSILPSCHTDRWSATLNQDGAKGGVIIFLTPFRQVWGLPDIEGTIHPSDLHLPIGSSSVILTWSLDGSPIQSNRIDPHYWAAAQVCGVWVHRYVCAFVFEQLWTAGTHPLTRVMTGGGWHHHLNGRFNAWSILRILLMSQTASLTRVDTS